MAWEGALSLKFKVDNSGKKRVTNRQVDFLGWILFIVSALGFIVASVGSFWAMFGSVFFLLACLVFIVPFFRRD